MRLEPTHHCGVQREYHEILDKEWNLTSLLAPPRSTKESWHPPSLLSSKGDPIDGYIGGDTMNIHELEIPSDHPKEMKKWNACEQCLIFRVAPILGEWYPQERLTCDFSDVPMFIFQTSFPLSTPCICGLGAIWLVLGKCGMPTFWLNYMYVEYPSYIILVIFFGSICIANETYHLSHPQRRGFKATQTNHRIRTNFWVRRTRYWWIKTTWSNGV